MPGFQLKAVLIVCPGIHDPQLTAGFLNGLWQQQTIQAELMQPLVFPVEQYPAFSAVDVGRFLEQRLKAEYPQNFLDVPLLFVGFSAGVVGAIGAAWGWQLQGGTVRGLIALDGWGVPLAGDFPIHRVSHDAFTHWSSRLLGQGKESFYAEPGVEHLDLWRSPQVVTGWQISPDLENPPLYTTAANFIATLIHHLSSSDSL